MSWKESEVLELQLMRRLKGRSVTSHDRSVAIGESGRKMKKTDTSTLSVSQWQATGARRSGFSYGRDLLYFEEELADLQYGRPRRERRARDGWRGGEAARL